MALSFTQPKPNPKSQVSVNVVEIIQDNDINGNKVEGDALDSERACLRRHLGLDSPHPTAQVQPLFFIERVPESKVPGTCSLPGCTAGIAPGSLRLALNPGMGGDTWFRSASDYYHIPCFETLADFTSQPYLNRIIPLTRNTFKLRGLKPSSVSDGSYLLPGGAERLVLEWKVTRGMAIDRRDGVFDPSLYKLDPHIYDLLYRAGARGYWGVGRPGGLDQFEYYTLSRTVAVNEFGSDGEGSGGEGEEWNLFEAFLGVAERDGEGRHDLSAVLGRWERGVNLAWQDSSDALSPVAVRAIRRLSTIPISQIGFNRIYS